MHKVPYDIWAQYESFLKEKVRDVSRHPDFKKWLLYFWDFRIKYPLPQSRSEQIKSFVEKLRQKKQSPDQQKQAAQAVSLFFAMSQKTESAPIANTNARQKENSAPDKEGHYVTETQSRQGADGEKASFISEPQWRRYSAVPGYAVRTASPEWDQVVFDLAAEIKTRHYSRKTLKAYADWSRKFQGYLKNKTPEELSASDVKAYLTHLAVNCKVSASTQNQAFNALLFLYRHILKKDFGDHKDIPRAKLSRYVPVVLSRREIDAVIKHLEHPYSLAVKLLYGCGLRLFECVQLRVHDFNFDDGILTVHGKGGKTRTVPIPQTLAPELKAQLEAVGRLYEKDLSAGFSGVFLDDSLEKKYPKAAKDFIWQWFFPQGTLTPVPEKNEIRRYHLHESYVQEALWEAVRRARLTKRVTAHTFRHSFAVHLLQANYDIRTIQTLLGHSDVRTTMIYTHCVPSRTLKEAKSPLDF